MGYTHFIRTSFKQKDAGLFALAVEQTKQIIALAKQQGVKITSTDDLTLNREELTPELINFNGYKQDSYENFRLDFDRIVDRVDWTNRCTTNRKPYDIVVVATLVALDQIFSLSNGIVILETNGKYRDWSKGIDLYADALNLSFELRTLVHMHYQLKFPDLF